MPAPAERRRPRSPYAQGRSAGRSPHHLSPHPWHWSWCPPGALLGCCVLDARLFQHSQNSGAPGRCSPANLTFGSIGRWPRIPCRQGIWQEILISLEGRLIGTNAGANVPLLYADLHEAIGGCWSADVAVPKAGGTQRV